jgi:hypothetical protein
LKEIEIPFLRPFQISRERERARENQSPSHFVLKI